MMPARLPGVFFALAVADAAFVPERYVDPVAVVLTVLYFVTLFVWAVHPAKEVTRNG